MDGWDRMASCLHRAWMIDGGHQSYEPGAAQGLTIAGPWLCGPER